MKSDLHISQEKKTQKYFRYCEENWFKEIRFVFIW